ncbi:MAG: electron transport protein SCO1/SenC [Bryobacterales bacterium]|nr:electron transport protein SCO1/SenC [Bryobacterales bacterium]
MKAAHLTFALIFAAAAGAKTWPVDGVVIAVDPIARTMLVSHRPIEKYMPAMAMPFRVAAGTDLAALRPGDRVTFDLLVDKDRSLARNVQKAQGGPGSIPPPKERIKAGDPVPGFTLIDEAGRSVQLADFKGRVLAIDFIYTRCPLPDVCPRLSANFATVAKRLHDRDVTFLSITVDPDYDTPAILADYARRWGATNLNWHFLTGDVAKAAGALGEVYWSDEGAIGHNSATAIVDRTGRLAATLEGSSWRADQLERLILHHLTLPKTENQP